MASINSSLAKSNWRAYLCNSLWVIGRIQQLWQSDTEVREREILSILTEVPTVLPYWGNQRMDDPYRRAPAEHWLAPSVPFSFQQQWKQQKAFMGIRHLSSRGHHKEQEEKKTWEVGCYDYRQTWHIAWDFHIRLVLERRSAYQSGFKCMKVEIS